MGTPLRRETRAYESDTDILAGLFYPAGTGAVTGQANDGNATVARSDVGIITVSFPCKFQKIYRAVAQLNMGTPDGSYAQVTGLVQTSGKLVMTLKTFTSLHAVADIAADASNFVTWELQAKR